MIYPKSLKLHFSDTLTELAGGVVLSSNSNTIARQDALPASPVSAPFKKHFQ